MGANPAYRIMLVESYPIVAGGAGSIYLGWGGASLSRFASGHFSCAA
jgi:hypothetical protein